MVFVNSKTLKLTKDQRNMFKHPKHVMFDDDVTERVLQEAAKLLCKFFFLKKKLLKLNIFKN